MFTITSAPKDTYISLHIRQVTDFTQALGEHVDAGPVLVAAITKAIVNGSEKDNSALRHVEFFGVCRDAPSFGWFQSLLLKAKAAQADRKF